MFHHIVDADAAEVVYLATAQDGGQNLMLFGSGQDEDGMLGWFLKSFQECVEGRGGKHVHLVDDIHLVLAYLGRYAYLFDELTDVFHRVVGSRIQFVDVIGALFVERLAGFTFVAGLSVFFRVQTIDGFGEDTGTGSLSHTAWTAEQVGMSQLVGSDGILQGGGQGTLAHYRIKRCRAVLPRRYDVILHKRLLDFRIPCKCT